MASSPIRGKHFVDEKTGKPICGAKNRKGLPCRGVPMANGRCHFHGGPSARGVAAPGFKHGRYSRYVLPHRLAEKYEEALADPELLNLRSELALVDTRIQELLSGLEGFEAQSGWGRALEMYDRVGSLMAAGKPADANLVMLDLGRLLNRGVGEYAKWGEIGQQIDRRRALVESERRRLVDMQQMMTTEQAMGLLALVVDIVRKNVHDQRTLTAISIELGNYVDAVSSGKALPG